MWINYLKTTWRVTVRQKSYSLLKLLSLAIGLGVIIYVLFYVKHETSYDKHFSDAGRIYRVVLKMDRENAGREFFHLMYPLKDKILSEIPQVTDATQVTDSYDRIELKYKDKEISREKVIYGDEHFFTLFDYELLRGNAEQALREPNSIVITRSFSEALFGDEDPMNKMVTDNNEGSYIVSGVIADPPTTTHMPFDVLVSLSTYYARNLADNKMNLWMGHFAFPTYFKLNKQASPEEVTTKLNEIYEENIGYSWEPLGIQANFYMQPLADIHLHSHLVDEYTANSDISTIIIFLASGIFILLIGSFNFINLSTAKSMKRAREVGMRRTLGGSRNQIVTQFMAEALMFTIAALLTGIVLLEVLLPELNRISGAPVTLSLLSPYTWIVVISVTLLTALLAGAYPAFYLSAFPPAAVLKRDIGRGKKKDFFRNTLVVVQFVISITLITGTMVVYDQMNYIQNKELGYDKEKTISVTYHKEDLHKHYKTLKEKIKADPEVEQATAALSTPVGYKYGEGFSPEGAKSPMIVNLFSVDEDYLATMGISLKEGRFFDGSMQTDSATLVMNEAFAEELGWDEPINKMMERNGKRYRVIGVVKDFHFQSLHRPVTRMLMIYDKSRFDNIIVKVAPGSSGTAALSKIEKTWKTYDTGHPFEFHFLSGLIDMQYKNDRQFSRMILYFSLLAIFIACTGLFGLAAFTAEQKTREIGIRKVMGATEKDILRMMITEFTKWVVIAAIIALPLSWYFMNNWLDAFAYHTDITLAALVMPAVVALVIASATVALQSRRAARLNPADTVKYE